MRSPLDGQRGELPVGSELPSAWRSASHLRALVAPEHKTENLVLYPASPAARRNEGSSSSWLDHPVDHRSQKGHDGNQDYQTDKASEGSGLSDPNDDRTEDLEPDDHNQINTR